MQRSNSKMKDRKASLKKNSVTSNQQTKTTKIGLTENEIHSYAAEVIKYNLVSRKTYTSVNGPALRPVANNFYNIY